MAAFEIKRLPLTRDAVAPDGSDVRVLLQLAGGSMAHFELAPRQTSTAVTHRSVEEIWFVLSGRGEMWRRQGEHEAIVALEAGVCLTIPQGTHFQFRALGETPLAAVGVTMPPWPGEGEAIVVPGPWTPSVP
jgi:mannose-6-phosphate isomerase-like protein (cupin superfamily)